MWSFNDLKEIENTTSKRYKLAISESIPDGFTQGFCKGFRQLKPLFQNTKAVPIGLIALQTASR